MDPLAAYADREVPEQTNYFDPAGAQTIISRYSNTRRNADASGKLLDRVSRVQDDAEQASQRRTLFNQHDEEYHSRKDALAKRGDFLRSLPTSLNPDDPDYPAQKARVLADMPEDLGRDDAVHATFASMDAQHEAGQRTRDAATARNERLQDAKDLYNFKLANSPTLRVLTPEELAQHRDPVTQELDMDGAYNAAIEKKRQNEKGDSKELIDERAKAQARKSEELDRRKSIAEVGVADQGAFPSQITSLLKEADNTKIAAYKKDNPKATDEEARNKITKTDIVALRQGHPTAYEDAKAYEDKKIDHEMASALSRDNPDDYVNLVPNATKEQKAKRLDLWKLAHEMKGNAAPEPVSTVPNPAASEPEEVQVVNGVRYVKRGGKVYKE